MVLQPIANNEQINANSLVCIDDDDEDDEDGGSSDD